MTRTHCNSSFLAHEKEGLSTKMLNNTVSMRLQAYPSVLLSCRCGVSGICFGDEVKKNVLCLDYYVRQRFSVSALIW